MFTLFTCHSLPAKFETAACVLQTTRNPQSLQTISSSAVMRTLASEQPLVLPTPVLPGTAARH